MSIKRWNAAFRRQHIELHIQQWPWRHRGTYQRRRMCPQTRPDDSFLQDEGDCQSQLGTDALRLLPGASPKATQSTHCAWNSYRKIDLGIFVQYLGLNASFDVLNESFVSIFSPYFLRRIVSASNLIHIFKTTT